MIVFFNDDLGAFSNSSSPQALLPPHPLPHAVENRTGLLCVRAGIIHREPLLRGQVIPEALPLKSHIFVVVVVVIFNPHAWGLQVCLLTAFLTKVCWMLVEPVYHGVHSARSPMLWNAYFYSLPLSLPFCSLPTYFSLSLSNLLRAKKQGMSGYLKLE